MSLAPAREPASLAGARTLMSVAETPAIWSSSMGTKDCGSCSSSSWTRRGTRRKRVRTRERGTPRARRASARRAPRSGAHGFRRGGRSWWAGKTRVSRRSRSRDEPVLPPRPPPRRQSAATGSGRGAAGTASPRAVARGASEPPWWMRAGRAEVRRVAWSARERTQTRGRAGASARRPANHDEESSRQLCREQTKR